MAVVQQLLEAGSSINARTASGTNALYNAATAGHVEAVQRLIDAGSELDVQAANGLTVLHSAASNGHCEVGPVPAVIAGSGVVLLWPPHRAHGSLVLSTSIHSCWFIRS